MPRPHRRTRPSNDPPIAEEAASPPRIIGGELRGRRLPFVPAGRTRPMKDRVRATLFDLLGPAVRDSLAIDLFAGTGAVGFEALSRAAAAAVFAERHFPTADAIRRTAVELGLAERASVHSGDVLLWAKRLPPLDRSRPWVVVISPPWSFFHERREELTGLIATMLREAPPGSRLVVEADEAFDPQDLPEADTWQRRAIPPAVLYLCDR